MAETKYSDDFLKLTFFGELADGEEIFQFGINMRIIGGTGLPESWRVPIDGVLFPQALTNAYTEHLETEAVQNAIREFWEDSDMNIPDTCLLQGIKVSYHTSGSGDYPSEDYEANIVDLGFLGGALGGYIPQVAVAVTLESGKSRPPAKYNRCFLPACSTSHAGAGKFENNNLMAEKFTSLLKTLEKETERFGDVNMLTIQPGIITGSPKHKGEFPKVQNVSVGSRFDTQRRRRNRLGEQRNKIKY